MRNEIIPDKKASRGLISNLAVFEDPSKRPVQFDWIIGTMLKTRKAFKKHIKGFLYSSFIDRSCFLNGE